MKIEIYDSSGDGHWAVTFTIDKTVLHINKRYETKKFAQDAADRLLLKWADYFNEGCDKVNC